MKTEFNAIINREIPEDTKDSLITNFFEKYKNNSDKEQELAACYYEYAKNLYYNAISDTDIEVAITYAKKEVAIREKYKNTAPGLLQKSLFNLGIFYKEIEDYFNAIKNYKKAIEVSPGTYHTDIETRAHRARNELGDLYSEIGDFEKALSYYEVAENYFKRDDVNDIQDLFKNHIDLLAYYKNMSIETFQDKIEYHIKKADSLLPLLDLAGEYIDEEDRLAISDAKGNLYDTQGKYQLALKHYKNSLVISKNMEYTSDIEISGSYSNLGITTTKLGRYEEAKKCYANALNYAGDDPGTRAMIFNNLGDYHLKKNEFETALAQYQNAVYHATGEINPMPVKELPSLETLQFSPDKPDLLGYLTDKANAWRSYYNYENNEDHLTQALKTLTLADKLIDMIRFESSEFKSKLFWREKGADIYMNAVAICYMLKLPEKAFYFMEKNKALLLLEDLTHENAKKAAGLTDSLIKKESELKQNIYKAEQELIAAREKTKAALRSIVSTHKDAYEDFITSLENKYPVYYNYKRKLDIITYDNVITTQQGRDLMLHYILNENEGYGLLVSETNPMFFKIDAVDTLHKNIELLRDKLTERFSFEKDFDDYRQLAFELYNTLFNGMDVDFLTGKKLCIIRDHNLQNIPFEALMTSVEAKDGYLLNQCQISYAYSASFLKLNQRMQHKPERYFVGFAPVEFSNLDALRVSEEEVNQIAKIFPGELFLREQASKENFLEKALNCKIIHLATHSDVGEDARPWIAFSDEKINLEDLYAKRGQTDMVVLSACNTSQGELKTGEGLMSLARGFFSSGTQSVVATLWSANDQTTKEIMVDFYKQLKKGRTRAEALQYAKQNYIKERSGSDISPYYWSSLILIGDAGELYRPAYGITTYLLFAALLLVLLLTGFWIRKRYRNR